MSAPDGVLPSPAIRDPRSTGLFIFGQLDPALTLAEVQAWLQLITGYLRSLKDPGAEQFDFAFGFGATFFTASGTPRFGMPTAPPAGFSTPATLPAQFPFAPDFVIYAMSPEEENLVQVVRWLTSCLPTPVVQLRVERGFQRANKRENFGFLDGLRNPGMGDRAEVALIGLDQSGDEPAWVQGGAYLTYMKISQAIGQITVADDDAMEQVIGRRKTDGSRLDLQPGIAAMDEPDFTNATVPSVAAHVRKAGPRGDEQGTTIGIFRRGLPYMHIADDGSVDFGLHFASFGDLDEFNTILTRWMSNPTFPTAGAGEDALLAATPALITFELAATFIVPPFDGRYIGAQIFDPEPTPTVPALGRVVVKKRVADASGNPLPQRSLRGAVFQVLQNGSAVGATFTTDAAGHAISGDVSTNVAYVLHEVTPLAGANAAPDQPFTVLKERQVLIVVNTFGQPPSGYNG
jgi:Dyp-type peroxidase family